MAVDGTNVIKPELFKNSARHYHAFDVLFCTAGKLFNRRNVAQQLFTAIADFIEKVTGKQTGQVTVQCTDVFRDRHLIVVKHHHQVFVNVPCMVQRFKRHTCCHRTVADNSNHFTVFAFFICCNSHTQRGADGCGRVTDSKGVVLTFRGPGERVQTIFLSDRRHAAGTAGQNFMRVSLMAHIP